LRKPGVRSDGCHNLMARRNNRAERWEDEEKRLMLVVTGPPLGKVRC
jgi:hypothetical protein